MLRCKTKYPKKNWEQKKKQISPIDVLLKNIAILFLQKFIA